MQQFLQNIKPTTWIGILGLFGLVGLVLLPQIAFANETLNGILFGIITTLTGWLLWVGGMLLDYGINTFVINFGTIFTTGGVGLAVDELWVLVRDLFNILFIFGLVYIGFKMILNSDDSQTKKTLVSLIIAALLINFSLFITKFVVDFTNILASEIATAGFDEVDLGNGMTGVAVGDTFFRLMGVSKLVLSAPPEAMKNNTSPWSYIFGIGIINIVGAFAFGVGGIMLIIRFIALSVYMVLSPFMFLGFIFPGFANMSSKYWSGFLKQSFYAPVYIIMIFFAASILNNFFGTGGSAQNGGLESTTRQAGSQGGSLFSPDGSVTEVANNFAGGIGPFILAAGFLIAAVQVAGKLAADGSSVMTKVTNGVNARVRRTVGRGAAGIPAYGLRNTVGAGANALTNNAGFKRRAANSVLWKGAYQRTQKAAESSFDVRRVGGLGKMTNSGEGQKGGFAKIAKDRAKKEDDFAKAIGGDFDPKAPESQPLIAEKLEEVRTKKREELDALSKSIDFEKIAIIDEIKDLKAAIATTGGATNEQSAKLTELNSKITQADEVTSIKIDNLTTLLNDSAKSEGKLRTMAIGQLKYQNELAYVEQLKRSEAFFGSLLNRIGGSAAAGGAAVTLTGGLGGVAVGTALAAMIGNTQSAKAGHKAITKRIGDDGTKGLKAEDSKKLIDQLKKEIEKDGDKKEAEDDDKPDES